MGVHHLALSLSEERLAVCRLEPSTPVPAWGFTGDLCSITRTPQELSVVCREQAVPLGIRCERGWRVFKVQGPLDFGLTGILDALTDPLARAGISIFALSTYDTDYLLVREAQLEEAVAVLETAGHTLAEA